MARPAGRSRNIRCACPALFPVSTVRKPDPLIIGAGPAGCAAAITLARGGAGVLVIDRDEVPGDPLCGGFLSWRTLAQLRELGVDAAALGGHRVERLRIFAGNRVAEIPLPHAALGLSRHALDTALRTVARAEGAEFAQATISELRDGCAVSRTDEWSAESIFLASGKRDLRGAKRPPVSADPALGLRLRLPPAPQRTELLAGTIELHLFRGGYAGIVLQEGGTANICLALRRSALARAGNSRSGLLASLAEDSPAFAERLGEDWRELRIDTISAVPYGWIARTTRPGLFRLGDQAAVIPSLAGEGIGIALASGQIAASHWLQGGSDAAPGYQRAFAAAALPPVRWGRIIRELIESPQGAQMAVLAANFAPSLAASLAQRTRIAAPSPALAALAPQRGAA